MKVVIGSKDGKSYQVEVPKENEGMLIGKRIGDEIEGDLIGVAGYTFIITGGSDLSGFPMRWDVEGIGKQRVLMSRGPGFKKKRAGERRKKTVHRKQIATDIHQINVKVSKEGPTPLEKMLGKAEEGEAKEEKKEEKKEVKEEKPKEEKKEKPKKEEKKEEPKEEVKEEKPEEKPEEKKEEAPEEEKKE